MAAVTLIVNGTSHQVDVAADIPLLYVLRNDLELRGPQFGCGLSQCGACSVLVDGKEARSCMLPVSRVAGKEITTLEGLPARWASQKGLPPPRPQQTLHPVQQAWIDEQVPHVRLLPERHDDQGDRTARSNADADACAQIKDAFMSGPSPHLCRCGSYTAIIDAVQHAATLMAKGR